MQDNTAKIESDPTFFERRYAFHFEATKYITNFT